MKKYIWISLLLVLTAACGTRSKNVDRSMYETKESVKSTETAGKQIEQESEAQLQVNDQKSEITQENSVKNEAAAINTENNSQKSNTENNTKQLKKVTYYPNGQKKSETELSENFSKVSEEKEMYRNKYEETSSQLDESIKKQNAIYTQNLDLKQRLDQSININKSLISESMEKDIQIKKLTEREGITFGSMIWIVIAAFIAGAVFRPLIKTLLPKLRINF